MYVGMLLLYVEGGNVLYKESYFLWGGVVTCVCVVSLCKGNVLCIGMLFVWEGLLMCVCVFVLLL